MESTDINAANDEDTTCATVRNCRMRNSPSQLDHFASTSDVSIYPKRATARYFVAPAP